VILSGGFIMFDKQLWEKAQKKAKKEYEKHYGDWEDADKYERQDLVFSEYMKLKEATK
jgi:hypothetical protein